MKLLSGATEQELISLFIAGNKNAFNCLALRHRESIYVAVLCLVKDKFLAEDIVQDAFIKILQSIQEGRYNEEGKFLPWALRIARNLCLDHIRLVKRTPAIFTNTYRDITAVISYHEENSEAKMIQAQSYLLLKDMLNYLPDDQRSVISFRLKDMSFKEIALLTNCSVNTALGRMRYGIIKLRKLMNQKQALLQ